MMGPVIPTKISLRKCLLSIETVSSQRSFCNNGGAPQFNSNINSVLFI